MARPSCPFEWPPRPQGVSAPLKPLVLLGAQMPLRVRWAQKVRAWRPAAGTQKKEGIRRQMPSPEAARGKELTETLRQPQEPDYPSCRAPALYRAEKCYWGR